MDCRQAHIEPGTSPVGLLQTHLSRYVWALEYCAGKSVLDVGCGCGYGTYILSLRAAAVLGIDINRDAIMRAKATYTSTHFAELDLEQCSGTHRWDVVVCFEVLEHLSQMEKGLEKIQGLLKPGGQCLLSVPLHQPTDFHHGRDFGYADWVRTLSPFRIADVLFQDVEGEYNNVCIRRVFYEQRVDWSEASLRSKPISGNIIFRLTLSGEPQDKQEANNE